MLARPALAVLVLLIGSLASTSSLASEPNQLSAQELADGWILLFDGETRFGWQANSQADWKVVDGALTVSSGEPGLLHTTTQFGDFELQADFRAQAETNSGIFLRTLAVPTNPAVDCYELNIAPAANPYPTGSLVARQKSNVASPATDDTWHTLFVKTEQGHIVVTLDGQPVLDYTDPKPLGRGLIGLQLNRGAISFRNIKLRPLGTQALFNGQDLSGWRDERAEQSVFTVADDGTLNMKNGRGQLESEAQYADFVFQTEIICHDRELNSGIFFRCIPGDFWMGYESQIHNGRRSADSDQPNNCGTGGIFRRQDARRIVADDLEWFHKTIVADGPHMAIWVNGIQVTDWTDTREPHDNPRKGLRLKAGTLILQGHDPTTNLSFRNLRITEIAPR